MRGQDCPKSAQPSTAAASPPALPQPCPAEVQTWLFPQESTNNFPSSGLLCSIIPLPAPATRRGESPHWSCRNNYVFITKAN